MSRFPHLTFILISVFLALTGAATATETKMDADSYTLRAGDLVRIAVWKEPELDREVQLLPDGTIDFPLIGTVHAAGVTTTALKKTITEKLNPFIPSATVTVTVIEARGNTISVTGQVAKPGEIIMNRKMTVMQAISQVGGLTTYADGDAIVILRTVDGKETSIPFDYDEVAAGEDLDTNIILEPGDVIVVPTASLF